MNVENWWCHVSLIKKLSISDILKQKRFIFHEIQEYHKRCSTKRWRWSSAHRSFEYWTTSTMSSAKQRRSKVNVHATRTLLWLAEKFAGTIDRILAERYIVWLPRHASVSFQSLLGLNMGCQGIKQPQPIRMEKKFSVQTKTEKVWDLNSWLSTCSFNLTDSNSDIDANVGEMICFLFSHSHFSPFFFRLGEGVHQEAEHLCNLRRFQTQGNLISFAHASRQPERIFGGGGGISMSGIVSKTSKALKQTRLHKGGTIIKILPENTRRFQR